MTVAGGHGILLRIPKCGVVPAVSCRDCGVFFGCRVTCASAGGAGPSFRADLGDGSEWFNQRLFPEGRGGRRRFRAVRASGAGNLSLRL